MNNEPDYNDNLYFKKKMTDCKNCPYTDEYCAGGECTSQSPRNGSQKRDLTSQWKKGELPEGVYYCNTGNTVEILFTCGKNSYLLTNNKDEVYIPEMDDCDEIIAPVPSYDEWKSLNKGYDSAVDANLEQATWMVGMEKENKRLKHDVGNLGYKIKNQRKEIDNRLKEIKKLKRLLTECASDFETYAKEDETCGLEEENKLAKNILLKIREVLK